MSSLENEVADITNDGSFSSGIVGPDLLALRSRRLRISLFDQTSLTHTAALLMTMDGQSDAPVSIEIGGSGQNIDAALQVLDVLGAMRAPVSCSCSLLASGTAVAILAAHPGRRSIKQRASVAMRLISGPATSNRVAADLTTAANVANHNHSALATAVAHRTGQSANWVLDQFDHGTVLTAGDALAFGLFDQVLTRID